MKKFLILIVLVLNLNAIDFVLIDSFNDAPNAPGAPIETGDIDNDGLAEVMFTGVDSITLYHQIYIYERYPTGGFYLAHIVPIYEPSSPWMGGAFFGFRTGDFDSDGKVDILESTYNANNMVEYFEVVESKNLNSYPDTIVWMDSLYIDSNSPGLDIWSGDLDNDGKTEILIYKGDATDLLIYENQGDDSYALKFHKDYYYGIPNGGSAVGDVDQDGLPEIFIADAQDYIFPIRVFECVGDDSLVNTANIYPWLWTSHNLYDAVFCGDVNNNGKPEVMIHGTAFIGFNTNRDDIWIIEATGDNQYELIWCDSLHTTANQEMGCVSSAGDVTGDGIPEIILSLTTGVRVIQYIPGQGYTYIWQKYYAYNTGNISTCVYDINGNGINDMILSVQHQEENRVTYIYEMSPSASEKYKKLLPYFKVFPSITSDSIRIFYSLKTKKLADFYIYNILGEKVYSMKLKPSGSLYLSFKKLKFKPGIYFIKLKSEKFKKINKINKVVFLK